jgi:hypothetical protein
MYPPEMFTPFSWTMIGLGATGCLSTFVFLVWRVKYQKGLSNLVVVVLSIVFVGSLFLATFGTQVKVISSISSGDPDDK